MELARAIRQAGVMRVAGLSVAALWLGSAALLAVPRTVHAQDDSAVSSDTSDVSNGADTDAEAANPNAVPANINGSWTGSATDKKHGLATLTMTFSQTEGSKVVFVQPWEVTFADTTEAGGSGSGKVQGKSIHLVLTDPTISDKCRADVSGKITVDSGVAEEIKGSYSLKGCFKPNSSGKFDLTPAT